jgi:hypothetical protein
MACHSLIDVVESGSRNIELAVMRRGTISYLSDEMIEQATKA